MLPAAGRRIKTRKQANMRRQQPYNVAPVDATATSAAAQAFLAKSKSNANLAAAAAGAALRSRPTTPTNVAEVQTKRTMRRSSVTSSRSGSVNGRPSSMLERRLSSGSMTERTFREPSPNSGAARPPARDAPPVPAIPAGLRDAPNYAGHGRSSSLQPTMRMSSPPPTNDGRGSSMQPPTRTNMRPARVQGFSQNFTPERPKSRTGSVNFSYPTSLQRRISDRSDETNRSLTPTRPAIDLNEMVYDSNTRSFRSRGDLMMYEQRVLTAMSQEPPRRKKSMRNSTGGAGTHLAQGSVGGRMKVGPPMVQRQQPVEQPQQQERYLPRTLRHLDAQQGLSPRQNLTERQQPQPPPQQQQHQHSPQYIEPLKQQRQTDSRTSNKSPQAHASDYESDASNTSDKAIQSSRKDLAKRPSVIHERSEPDDSRTDDRHDKVLGSQATVRHSKEHIPQGIISTPATRTQKPELAPQAAPEHIEAVEHSSIAPQLDKLESNLTEATLVNSSTRGPSLSPTRKPQFLSPADPVSGLRHEPPYRSISPRKSALKRSSSRGPSPFGENPADWTMGHGSAELSDASTDMSGSRPMRRKSVRVSFDEGSNVMVPEELIEVPIRRIRSGGSYRGTSNSPFDEEPPADMMGARPVLPIFGSVRKREHVEMERPLVKPYEGPAPSTQHAFGPSSDHAVGGILTQDHATKPQNEPNISKSREPVPTVVTSIENDSYGSDESSDSVQIAQAPAIEIPPEEREAPQGPDHGMRKPRFIEDLGDESDTPTKEMVEPHPLLTQQNLLDEQRQLFHPENDGGDSLVSAPPSALAQPKSKESAMSDGKISSSLPFTPSEDDDLVTLTRKAVKTELPNGTPPNLVVTVPTPIAEQKEWQPKIPGGLSSWDSDESVDGTAEAEDEFVDAKRGASPEQMTKDAPLGVLVANTEVTPAQVGIAEPEPVEVQHAHTMPAVGGIATETATILELERGRPRSTHSDVSEGNSVYSDAAERLTDNEDGEGFMSLDAVVESPTAKVQERFVAPASISPRGNRNRTEEDEDWVKTQLYWSALSNEKKRELEAEAKRLALEESSDDETPTRQRPQKQRQRSVQEAGSAPKMAPRFPAQQQQQQPQQQTRYVSPVRNYQIQPGAKGGPNGVPTTTSAMRHSFRQPKQQQTMETGGSGRMRTSLRDNQPPPQQYIPPAPAQRQRPVSSSNRPQSSNGLAAGAASAAGGITATQLARAIVLKQNEAKAKAEQQAQTSRNPLQRRGSAGSDSSFKRERPKGEGFFNKSMRNGTHARTSSPPVGERGRRFSVRSMSPVGRRPQISAPSTARTTTLRDNNGPAASSQTTEKTGGFFGRRKGKAPAAATGSANIFGKSRFIHSDSDEDAPAPQTFKSRFADSESDDEADFNPAPMASRSMGSRSFRSRTAGKLVAEPERPRSAIQFGQQTRPTTIRKPSRVLEEDENDLEDFDIDAETREKTRLNESMTSRYSYAHGRQQSVEEQAAAQGVNPEAIRLAQAYFGKGLTTTTPHQGMGNRMASGGKLTKRTGTTTPPEPSITVNRNAAAGSIESIGLSPNRTVVPPANLSRSPPPKEKKGFMSSILGRKKKDPSSQVGKNTTGDFGARRDTSLERNQMDLDAARRLEEPLAPRVNNPKLRKKGAPQLERAGSFNSAILLNSQVPAVSTPTVEGVEAPQVERAGHPVPETAREPIDGVGGGQIVHNDAIKQLRADHPRTGGPVDGVEDKLLGAHKAIDAPKPEHGTSSGPTDGVETGKDKRGSIQRSSSAATVDFAGVTGDKKKDGKKKKGFLRRIFDLQSSKGRM